MSGKSREKPSQVAGVRLVHGAANLKSCLWERLQPRHVTLSRVFCSRASRRGGPSHDFAVRELGEDCQYRPSETVGLEEPSYGVEASRTHTVGEGDSDR